jgi:hypothetical protein
MRRPHYRSERGMVTAETAVVLPIVAAFVLALLWLISAAIAEVRLVDASRDAARALARGEDAATVAAQVSASAPDGTQTSITHDGTDVTVEVSVVAEPPGWLLVPLPGIPLHASATTQDEAGSDVP